MTRLPFSLLGIPIPFFDLMGAGKIASIVMLNDEKS
jgi:hypothetical protein